MSRFWMCVSLAALLAFAAGCAIEDNRNPAAAEDEWNLSLSVGFRNEILIPAGVEFTAPLTALVTKNGAPAAGITVAFDGFESNSLYGADAAGAVFEPPSATTDANGVAHSTLRLNLPRGQFNVSIHAEASGDAVDYSYLRVTVTGRPNRVLISAPSTELLVLQDEAGQMTFTALVVDSGGAALSGVPIAFRLEADSGATFGTLVGPTATGYRSEDSKAAIVFDSRKGLGRQKIVVATDYSDWDGPEVISEMEFTVRSLSELAGSLVMSVNPRNLVAAPDSLVTSLISAQVTRPDRRPIPGIYVRFSTDFGTITGSGVTDNLGVATAAFTNNFASGTAHITAWIPGTDIRDDDTLVVAPGLTLPGTLSVTSDRSYIYADGGVTTAVIRALLKDSKGDPVSGAQIHFSCRFGAISSPVTTDALGIAEAVFTDMGVPSEDEHGNAVPDLITASYNPWNLEDTEEVWIRSLGPIGSVTLSASRLQLIAGSEDRASVRATVSMETGDFAPEGVIVYFNVSNANGRFTRDAVPVGAFGVAETEYIAGSFVGQATLTATVRLPDQAPVESNHIEITLLPGPPSQVRVRANPSIIYGDSPFASAQVIAVVTDTTGNPVIAGTLVRFSAPAGEITPAAVTDTAGLAIANFRPGGFAGDVVVTATVSTRSGNISGTVQIHVTSSAPSSMEFSISPEEIGVSGGGQSTATARAVVRDYAGNPVEHPVKVIFTLLYQPDEPLGCNINNHGRIDSALTANGVATASVNAGERIGPVLLRAYTWRDPDTTTAGPDGIPRTDTISVFNSRLRVAAGPPFQIGLAVDSRGEDAGGGIWELEVACSVWDANRNPTPDGHPVIFTVNPPVAVIENSVTGSRNMNGATSPGVAYSRLRYQSSSTFEPIEIRAETQSPNGLITSELPFVLPLQRGRVILAADPGNWTFDREHPDDTCLVRVWAAVRDGHDVLINNAPVIFTVDRARFYWRNIRINRYVPFFPEPARRFTGLVNQENNEPQGQATIYWRAIMDDVFLDPFTLEVAVRLEAAIEGYDDAFAEPISIRAIRH